MANLTSALEHLTGQFGHLTRIVAILDAESGRESALHDARFARNNSLAEDVRTRTAELAVRDQMNANRALIDDVDENGQPIPDPGVIDQNGNKVFGRRARELIGEHDTTSHRLPFLRKLEAAKLAQARFQAEPMPSRAWIELSNEIADWSRRRRRGLQFEVYQGPGRKVVPDAERMSDCGSKAGRLRDEHDEVRRCLDDLATAEAAIEQRIAAALANPPLGISIPDNLVMGPSGRDPIHIWTDAKQSDLPLALALWLDPEGTRKRLLDELRGKYAADRRPKLNPDERAKRLKALRTEITELELEESWHLLALVERGESFEPRPNLHPRAVLQLRPAS